MVQKAFVKADGLSRTKSLQVAALEAQVLVDQTFPAQSPQKVVSNTIC